MRYKDILEAEAIHKKKLIEIANYAQTEDGSAIWTEVQPELSQLGFTFWVPMDNDYPFVIVDPTPGFRLYPSDKCQAFELEKVYQYPQVQNWVNEHMPVLIRLMFGKIGCKEFYKLVRLQLNTKMP